MESLSNLLRSPVRLFFTLMVIYVASHSVVCGVFIAIVGASWVYHRVIRQSRNIPTPRDVVMPVPQSTTSQSTQPQAPEAPVYAKSAVVVPMKRPAAARRSA